MLLINPADNPLSPEFYRLLAHNFGPAVLPLIAALVVCTLLTPAAGWLGQRIGAVAHPGERTIHARPTTAIGGLALAAGFTVAALVFATGDANTRGRVVGLIAMGLVTVLVMSIDDIRPLGAWPKLALQIVLAVVASVVAGLSISSFSLGGGHVYQLGVLALPITVVWLVGMQNTMNLLDGVDGLAAGVAAIVALALLLAAVNRETQDSSLATVVILSAALIGACVGFLFFNFHPARIFMGDGGAHFLGMTLGLISILGIAKGAVVFAMLVPVMALLVPIADTALAIIRRRRQRVSIAHPDSAHIHHQLLDFGLSQRETCLVFYFATGITSGFGLMLFGHRKILSVVVVLLVVALSTLVGERLYEIEFGQPAKRIRESP